MGSKYRWFEIVKKGAIVVLFFCLAVFFIYTGESHEDKHSNKFYAMYL